MKILALRLTHLSAIATELLEKERERGGGTVRQTSRQSDRQTIRQTDRRTEGYIII